MIWIFCIYGSGYYLNIICYLQRNLNKLSIKHQPYSKSRKIDAFEQNKYAMSQFNLEGKKYLHLKKKIDMKFGQKFWLFGEC